MIENVCVIAINISEIKDVTYIFVQYVVLYDGPEVYMYEIKLCYVILQICGYVRHINQQFTALHNAPMRTNSSFFLGAAEYNFTFVPHFTRFHWSNNAHVKL